MAVLLSPRYAPIDTPLGPGWYAYTDRGVVVLTARGERSFLAEAMRVLGVRPVRKDPPAAFVHAVREGIESGDGAVVDWSRVPEFQARVLRATARIRPGRVASYGDVARTIGNPRAMRAVGTALARNPVPLLVPCHRVVRGDGTLGNYGMGGTRAKRALLVREGYVTRSGVRSGRRSA